VRLIVRPEAEADIGDAYAWYEAQRPGLGQRFVGEVSRCFDQIQSAPKRYQPVRAEARRAYFAAFPTASSSFQTTARSPCSRSSTWRAIPHSGKSAWNVTSNYAMQRSSRVGTPLAGTGHGEDRLRSAAARRTRAAC